LYIEQIFSEQNFDRNGEEGMEGLIIWLIILAVAIYNSKRKAKQKSAQQRPQNYQQQSYQRPQGYRQQGYRQQPVKQAQGYQTRTNGNPNMAQMQAEMARKQQELKNRLQQKYAGMTAGTNARPVQQNVSYRAPQQVAQNSVPQQKPVQQAPQNSVPQQKPVQQAAQNSVPQQKPVQQAPQNSVPQQKPMQQKNDIMSRAVANVKENEVDELAKSSELMNQVNDLMIMGYQADLSFARDFVAEGIDMLNSYEIPEF